MDHKKKDKAFSVKDIGEFIAGEGVLSGSVNGKNIFLFERKKQGFFETPVCFCQRRRRFLSNAGSAFAYPALCCRFTTFIPHKNVHFTDVIFIYTSKTNAYYSHSLYRRWLGAGHVCVTAELSQGITPAT
ncbi:hypothetical protein [Chimaeribacter arupi]|uniref:hypothetical protein n=1 Tax=Chimaeribacter arupi TaxID=2060066 RepID=UPI0011AF66E5|nr:hypothetical protein [Chimaeribacter arupi]